MKDVPVEGRQVIIVGLRVRRLVRGRRCQIADWVWTIKKAQATPGVEEPRARCDAQVWTKAYNDTATGAAGWRYPEFKGYHANPRWAVLHTTSGNITMVAE